MQKRILMCAVLCAALAGCSGLPSLDHCSEVQYSRVGTDIALSAKCTAGVAM